MDFWIFWIFCSDFFNLVGFFFAFLGLYIFSDFFLDFLRFFRIFRFFDHFLQFLDFLGFVSFLNFLKDIFSF